MLVMLFVSITWKKSRPCYLLVSCIDLRLPMRELIIVSDSSRKLLHPYKNEYISLVGSGYRHYDFCLYVLSMDEIRDGL